jgi:hypothetical protein
LLYWCLNKRFGLFAFAGYTAGLALNALVKLTACVYCPWIRDSRVFPAGDAIRTATVISECLLIFYIILLWPIVIKLVTNKTHKTEN